MSEMPPNSSKESGDFYLLLDDPHLREIAETDTWLGTRLESLRTAIGYAQANPKYPDNDIMTRLAEENVLHYIEQKGYGRFKIPEE